MEFKDSFNKNTLKYFKNFKKGEKCQMQKKFIKTKDK